VSFGNQSKITIGCLSAASMHRRYARVWVIGPLSAKSLYRHGNQGLRAAESRESGSAVRAVELPLPLPNPSLAKVKL